MNNHKKEPNYLESQNRVLFVGNGINDAQKINWNDMLIYVQDRLFEDKSIDSEKISNLDGTSPTLFFESSKLKYLLTLLDDSEFKSSFARFFSLILPKLKT